MASYKDIQQQIAALQEKAEEARAAELGSAIKQIKALMQEFGITVEDLQKKSSKGKSLSVQFRDGENTWSGRGCEPSWLKDKDKEQYRVKEKP